MHQLIFILNQIFTICKIVLPPARFTIQFSSSRRMQDETKELFNDLFYSFLPSFIFRCVSISPTHCTRRLSFFYIICILHLSHSFCILQNLASRISKSVCVQHPCANNFLLLRIYTSQQKSLYRFLPADIGINEV